MRKTTEWREIYLVVVGIFVQKPKNFRLQNRLYILALKLHLMLFHALIITDNLVTRSNAIFSSQVGIGSGCNAQGKDWDRVSLQGPNFCIGMGLGVNIMTSQSNREKNTKVPDPDRGSQLGSIYRSRYPLSRYA
jgi:hypothetical protein